MNEDTQKLIQHLNDRIASLEKIIDTYQKKEATWQAQQSELMSMIIKLNMKLDTALPTITKPSAPVEAKTKTPTQPAPTAPISSARDSVHAPKALTYANIAAKNAPAPKKKRARQVPVAVVQRVLSEPSGPSAYNFVYLPCRHHIKHSAVRRLLRSLKIVQSRILDVQFPARGTIALLVHADYKSELVSLLTENKVHVKSAFDPTNADILGDPKIASCTAIERKKIAQKVYSDRMMRTCLRLPHHLGLSIVRAFTNTIDATIRLPASAIEQYLAQRCSNSTKPASTTLSTADFQPPVDETSSDADLAMDGSGEIVIDVPDKNL